MVQCVGVRNFSYYYYYNYYLLWLSVDSSSDCSSRPSRITIFSILKNNDTDNNIVVLKDVENNNCERGKGQTSYGKYVSPQTIEEIDTLHM